MSEADKALCDYAERLTLRPQEASSEHLTSLRAQGFEDSAIHDATQIISYFNYINRMVHGLGQEYDEYPIPWEQGPEGLVPTD